MTNITEGLEEQRIPIDVPVLHPENYRKGNVEAIAASLARFGQVKPIVIQKATGYVVAGNHTLRAAQSLGWEEIAAVVVDLTDEEATGYLVADNRLSDLAENDEAVLAPILQRMMDRGQLEGTGYTPDDTEDMLTRMAQIPDADPGEFEGGHAITDEELAERFKNRSHGAPARNFVLQYTADVAAQVDKIIAGLNKVWGLSGTRYTFLEALRRAAIAEGMDVDALAEPDPTDVGADSPAPDASAPAATSETEDNRTPLERVGLVNPPGPETPPQPATLGEQREQEAELRSGVTWDTGRKPTTG